ncbi:hypothetical protein FOA43_000277 [Brettanomyces nanus]|uniref:Uncharacterized protein n=1 Tax=Eeniella nana TaxID=13502 RepID=A0A875RWU6_EENNA|nr:uncharacterized protein FOA43_000277 [Brettanomyces nanus]QPG72973.1 hypothetical protein FOA43_000277 [Brettanomyces nanus]
MSSGTISGSDSTGNSGSASANSKDNLKAGSSKAGSSKGSSGKGSSGKGSFGTEASLGNTSPFKAGVASTRSGASSFFKEKANRLSLLSSYSGVVHNADVDTIQYVVSKSPTRETSVLSNAFSELRTVTSGNTPTIPQSPSNSIRHSLTLKNINKALGESAQDCTTTPTIYTPPVSEVGSIQVPLILPTTPKTYHQNDMSSNKTPDREQTMDLEIPIPARSAKRPNSVYLDPSLVSPSNSLKDFNADSVTLSLTPKKKSRINLMGPRSPPPISPLPSPTKDNFITELALSDKGHKRTSTVDTTGTLGTMDSMTSKRSEVIGGKLDDIMQQVENVRCEIDGKAQPVNIRTPTTPVSLVSNSSGKMGVESHSILTSTESFHTAQSFDSDWVDDEEEEKDNENDEQESLQTSTLPNVQSSLDRASISTLQNPAYVSRASTVTARDKHQSGTHISPQGYTTSRDWFNKTSTGGNRALPGTASSSKYSLQQPNIPRPSENAASEYPSSSIVDSPSFRASVLGKTKKKNNKRVKSFSYDTLARLLNATDGIVIGQEFANLGMPNEEKYLIEKIVTSLSRLTANMMINPNRYDQSCTRLENVLNMLEGFD